MSERVNHSKVSMLLQLTERILIHSSCSHTRHWPELKLLWTSGRYLDMVMDPSQG